MENIHIQDGGGKKTGLAVCDYVRRPGDMTGLTRREDSGGERAAQSRTVQRFA